MQQHAQADEAGGARDTAGSHRDQLLLLDRDHQRVEPCWRQQPDRMAHQQEQDTHMKQVGAPTELALAQHLAGRRAPCVLLAVEPDEAAQQEHRQADVWIPDER